MQSLAAQQGTSHSVAAQSVAAQPVAVQSFAGQPVAARTVAAQSSAGQSVAARSLAAQSVAVQSVAVQSAAEEVHSCDWPPACSYSTGPDFQARSWGYGPDARGFILRPAALQDRPPSSH